jgi:prostaglandin-E synthase
MQEIKKRVGPQDVRYLLKKANSKFWPRLLKTEGKPPFLKIDSVSI